MFRRRRFSSRGKRRFPSKRRRIGRSIRPRAMQAAPTKKSLAKFVYSDILTYFDAAQATCYSDTLTFNINSLKAIHTTVAFGTDGFQSQNGASANDAAFLSTWAGLFSNYVVYGAKITCRMMINAVARPAAWYFATSDDATAITAIQNVEASAHAMTGMIQNGRVSRFSKYVSMGKVSGHSMEQILGDANFTAATTGAPTSKLYGKLVFWNNDGTAEAAADWSGAAITVSVKIVFYVQLKNVKAGAT